MFSAVTLVLASAHSFPTAFGASSTCTEAPARFARLAPPPAYERAIQLSAREIEPTLNELLAHSPGAPAELRALLRMGLENALQHGVEDMYLPLPAALRIRIAHTSAGSEIEITNELFKKFPARLEQTFRPGDNLALTSEERPFPRGFGIGLGQMFKAFEKFPPEARMGWRSRGGQEATFRVTYPR